MTKRALLIGSQTFGLSGVNGDVELMAETLEARGFKVRRRVDADATRSAILAAYEKLITETPEGSTDSVVVYYSGHGGRTALPNWEERQRRGQRSHLRYIVPFDMAASTETDFRGVLAEELSHLQRRLTARTENVTTILDSCHSGTMSRDPSVLPKAVGRDFPLGGALDVLNELDKAAASATLDESNRLAVRVVACDPLQSAYERRGSFGRPHGVLTEHLVLTLRELGDRAVSWRVIGERVRRSVTASFPMQRPEIEGPADRIAFSLDRRSSPNALPVTVDDGIASIKGARLFALAVGDSFRLLDDEETDVATATIARIDGDRAVLLVDRRGASAPLPTAMTAAPLRTSRTRAVRLELPAELADVVAAKVDASSLLHIGGDDEPEAPVAIITEDEGLAVRDVEGVAVRDTVFPSDDAGASGAVELVEHMAKAERLRALASGQDDDDSLAGKVVVELASHDDHGRIVRQRTGERLYAGEPISVTITNTSPDTLYVGLFDIDATYTVRMVNGDEPSGWRLPPGATKVIGGPTGTALTWDETVPATEEHLETLLVIAATERQDFMLLETPRALTRRATPPSELEAMLAEAGSGSRAWPVAAPVGKTVRHRVEPIDFFLTPGTKPDVDEPPFAIREMPDLSQRAVHPRGLESPPPSVAVRLVSLKVRNNKALFRAAVRLDALVITAIGDQVMAIPFTQRFPAIADGDLLPMDNLPLHLGEVRDFLDLAVWVNRDDTKGAELARLFEQAVTNATTKEALTVIAGAVLAAPQVAAAVGAVAAVATLVRVGAELVQAAVGKEIGLYRTSFLAFERFGEGRHPAEGLRRAQGIEFAFEVIDVSIGAGESGR